MKFVKIDLSKQQFGSLYLSAYEVWVGGEKIGVVWSQEGFSYRGENGWNSGIRIQDFSPTEWHCGPELGRDKYGHRNTYRRRSDAAMEL